jgi:hypothetical protein
VYTNGFFVYITHHTSSDITILKQPRHLTACLDINKLTKENDEPHHNKTVIVILNVVEYFIIFYILFLNISRKRSLLAVGITPGSIGTKL